MLHPRHTCACDLSNCQSGQICLGVGDDAIALFSRIEGVQREEIERWVDEQTPQFNQRLAATDFDSMG